MIVGIRYVNLRLLEKQKFDPVAKIPQSLFSQHFF